eukprot:TRINITY_DN955_c0_g1_i1.p1 TRINITY_DN955_c0_g1~~TRINITY_DN955_c0_g1_i1.p1  ORF type:complete len:192 (+),score=45.05 TRINITY_DN955_c0_g1_i1:73-576(+)
MQQICLAAESAFHYSSFYREVLDMQPHGMPQGVMENICASAVSTSMNESVGAILTCSLHGSSPLLLSKYRPKVPIIVATTNSRVSRTCHLSRGCYPFTYNKIYDQIEDFTDYMDQMIQSALVYAHDQNIILDGDKIVVVSGWGSGEGKTNTIRVRTFSLASEASVLK